MSHWRAVAEGEDAALQATVECGYATAPACSNSGGIRRGEAKDLI